MADFDPDAYLAATNPQQPTQQASAPFDPDEYLQATNPQMGSLESAGRAVANNIPLVPQAIAALSPGDYSQNLGQWNQNAIAARQEHPIAYGVGAVGGALAPALIPGVGEGDLATQALTGAGLGAANAISNEDLKKNPEDATKEVVVGGLTGGALSAALGYTLPKIASGLGKFSEAKALQSPDFKPGFLASLEPNEKSGLASLLRSENLIGGDPVEVMNRARALQAINVEKIAEIGDKVGATSLDSEEVFKMADELNDKADELSQLGGPEATQLAKTYVNNANTLVKLVTGSEENQKFLDLGGELVDKPATWNDISNLKKQYEKIAFNPNGSGEIINRAHSDTYFMLGDMLKSIASNVQDQPELGDEYRKALMNYSQMAPVVKAAEKSGDASLRGTGGPGGFGIMGMIRRLPPALRAIIVPAAFATGHTMVGIAGLMPEITNPGSLSNAAYLGSKLAKGGGKLATPVLNDALMKMLSDQYLQKRKVQQP